MSIAEARKSASMLIMCEDAETQEIKVLLLTRASHSRVWPNALVFPGGLSEADDDKIGHKLEQVGQEMVQQAPNYQAWGMRDSTEWYSALGTALRETKEECALDLFELMSAGQGEVTTQVQLIAHWLTPNALKKRYDTFIWGLGLKSEYTKLSVDPLEISEAKWWGISEALQAYDRGLVDLPVPTFIILSELNELRHELGSQASVSQLLTRLAESPHSLPIQPIIVKAPEISLYLPGDQTYISNAQHGELEAQIDREFWRQTQHHLKHKLVQVSSDSKPLKRWYRVCST